MKGYSIAMPFGGYRGAGLGNQAIPMGKAWLAAQVLDQHYVDIPWSLNPRGYRKELGSARLDWLRHLTLRTSTRPVEVTIEEYMGSGILDYREFIQSWAADNGRSLIHTSGMSGGYASIAGARDFLASRLTQTDSAIKSPVRTQLQQVRLEKVTVAVHVRAGDFGSDAPSPGAFNNRIPITWYEDVIDFLSNGLGDDVHFFFVTEPDAIPLVSNLISRLGIRHSTLSSGTASEDLGILSSADLVVCSISSFSLLASFLGGNDYIWYSGHLTALDGSAYIWPDRQSMVFSEMRNRDERFKLGAGGIQGMPYPGDRGIQEDLLARLRRNLSARHPESNMLFYGSIDGTYLKESST
ncbi:hypothetical protein [Pseudarthrobacter sp. fls2-241-R2A-127]|uniref:hypothetical protein n=1 Tax=Pseudarthrobacter sp. fls2-241-R2A-127 TaxID=3040303 RepID=UPI002554D3CB|nr:hypothetical protein [Pseudarthrobacter sp. fls2-241-R2A-127]